MVHRGGGAIYLAPIAQDVRQIRVGVDKTAAELAVARLTKEIAVTNDDIDDAKKQDYSHFVPKSTGETLLLIGIIGTGVLALAFGFVGENSIGLVLLSLLIPLVFFHSRAGKKRQEKIDALRNAEIERLASILFAKKATLRKQHDIAST